MHGRTAILVVLATLIATLPGEVVGARPAHAGYSLPPAAIALSGAPAVGGVALGDFNADGKLDLLTSDGAMIHYRAGNGDGSFGSPVTVANFSTTGTGMIVTGDFNRDGKLDFAFVWGTGYANSSGFQVLLGNGDGTFSGGAATMIGYLPALAVGDVTGDGVPDLVMCQPNAPPGAVHVWKGNGDGTFAEQWYSSMMSDSCSFLAAGDLNGDGRADVVVGGGNNGVTVLITGTGAFSSMTEYPTASESTGPVTIGDLNGDGRPDIVVAINNGATLGVLLNSGGGAFSPITTYGPGINEPYYISSGLATTDLNHDARPDVVLAAHDGTLQTWGSRSDGSFAPANSAVLDAPGGTATPLTSVAAGDLNGDGLPDFAALGGTSVYIVLANAVPSPPVNVTAVAGIGSATVSWQAPADNAGQAVTSYTVTSSGGAVQTVGGSTTSVVMTGLSTAVHTFTVTATTSAGTSAASAPSNTVLPLAGGTYHPQAPQRILDTRTGNGTGGVVAPITQGATMTVQVAGRGGVPASGVSSVVVNVTATDTSWYSFLSVFPAGMAVPNASSLNWGPGNTVANLLELPLGNGGALSMYNSLGTANVIFDVQGWVGNSTNSSGRDGLFNPLTPQRILDTRTGNGTGGSIAQLGPQQSLTLQVTGRGGVPATGVSAVVVNLTETTPSQWSYLTAYPAGVGLPNASNLNFGPGLTRANRVMVALGSGGQITIYNSAGSVDVIVDVNGWFTDATSSAGGSAFVGIAPTRIYDTRTAGYGPLGPRETLILADPNDTLTSVRAFVMNVTVTDTTWYSYLEVWPYGAPQPNASDINWVPGQTNPNLVVVAAGDYGGMPAFVTYNSEGTTSVIYDLVGYYGSPVAAPAVAATHLSRVAGG